MDMKQFISKIKEAGDLLESCSEISCEDCPANKGKDKGCYLVDAQIAVTNIITDSNKCFCNECGHEIKK